MNDMIPASVERIDGPKSQADATNLSYLRDVDCGARYGFGPRHWGRLVDRGAAPAPVRFGRLTRWKLSTLEEWERDGCKPIRTTGKVVR